MNPGSYEHETCTKRQLISYIFKGYQYLKIEVWTKVPPFLKSAHISQRKNNNQNKIDVFFIIFKIYWSVKNGVLMKRHQEVLNFFDLEPLTHGTVALISAKLSLALIQYIVLLYLIQYIAQLYYMAYAICLIDVQPTF